MADEVTTATTDTTATDTTATNDKAQATNADNKATDNPAPLTAEAIEKIIQSRVDKITADLGKKYADSQKELENVKKDKMTADELAKYELEKEKQALANERKELIESKNRLAAINELTKVELYDGSENANNLLNMVVNGVKEESEIAANVTALKSVIDKLVSAKVSETFKANGRVPNGGGQAGNESGKEENKIATDLGKKAAERTKSSNDILNYYYGGKR